MAERSVSKPVYCLPCGQAVEGPTVPTTGGGLVHITCVDQDALAGQRGRALPPRDQLIAGETPQLADIPAEAMPEVLEWLRFIEQQAQQGDAHYGCGFLLVARQGQAEPLVMYLHPQHAAWESFINEADLMQAVQTYDQVTQFVIFEAAADTEAGVFSDIQISIWSYQYIPTLARTA